MGPSSMPDSHPAATNQTLLPRKLNESGRLRCRHQLEQGLNARRAVDRAAQLSRESSSSSYYRLRVCRQEWRFPRIGAFERVWQHWRHHWWHLGDVVPDTPSIDDPCCHGPRMRGEDQRVIARKVVVSDFSKYYHFTKFVETKGRGAGTKWTDIHNSATVTEMYQEVARHLTIRGDGRIDPKAVDETPR
jgi:hypothetical protein